VDSGSISAAATVFADIVGYSLLQRWAPYNTPAESDLPPYSAIKSVRYFKAPNGDIKECPYFSIEFDDGERWTTGDGLRDTDLERDRRLIEYVSGRCGRQPQEADIE
jgi:hypothetical protein